MQEKNTDHKIYTDDLGRKVIIEEVPEKIISLSSSVTEILYTILPENRILARTQNDSFPPQVLKKPVINNYPVDYEKLAVFMPDLVISKEGIISLDAVEKITKMGIPVYLQKYDKVGDVIKGIENLGVILGVKDRALKVADSLRYALSNIKRSDSSPIPSVLIVISEDPIYVFGKDSYATSMIELAGGRNAVDKVFENTFPSLRREYILKMDPDVIIGVDSLSFFSKYPELKNLKAFKNKRLFQIDQDLISRPGPRVVDGIKKIQELLDER